MRDRLPLAVSLTALLVALLGATSLGEAARDAVVKSALFARNAGMVNGIKASKRPQAGLLVPLGRNGRFPASVVAPGPAGPPGPRGAAGPTGPTGAAGSINGVSAGGDLAGTYPNPELAEGRVTASKLADDAVTSIKVEDRSLRLADIAALSGQVSVDPPSIPGRSCATQAVTIPGRAARDMLILQPTPNLSTGLVVMSIFDVNASDSFGVRICNVTNSAIDAPSGAWGYAVLRT